MSQKVKGEEGAKSLYLLNFFVVALQWIFRDSVWINGDQAASHMTVSPTGADAS